MVIKRVYIAVCHLKLFPLKQAILKKKIILFFKFYNSFPFVILCVRGSFYNSNTPSNTLTTSEAVNDGVIQINNLAAVWSSPVSSIFSSSEGNFLLGEISLYQHRVTRSNFWISSRCTRGSRYI